MGRYNKGGVKYALPMRSQLKVYIVPFKPMLKGHDALLQPLKIWVLQLKVQGEVTNVRRL